MRERPSQFHVVNRVGMAYRLMTLALFFVIAFSSAVLAQPDRDHEDIDTPGLVIEAVIGWDGIVDRSLPIPVSFLIHNYTERNIDGRLTLTDSIDNNRETLGEVSIAPGTTKRFTSIQSMANWFECVATFRTGRKILWRRELVLNNVRWLEQNVKVAFFIDEGGRKLNLSGIPTESSTNDLTAGAVETLSTQPTTQTATQASIASEPRLQCVTVKPWQIPNHPGPLTTADCVIFPDGAIERNLNQVQWKALAVWMCQGGTIFVHNKSQEVIDRLIQLTPLSTEVASPSGRFQVRRFGLGALYEYDEPLMTSASRSIQQSIAETTESLSRNQINSFSDLGWNFWKQSGRANKNRVFVGALFGIYTFLSGLVALALFRRTQRQIAIYIVVVVAGTSMVAAMLGGYLRFSQGDLYWVTVTQAGVGGLAQVGSLDVQSAGSRNTRVSIKGEHADLQFVGTARQYGRRNASRSGYSSFTWQRNMATEDDHSYQINVPMTIWGRRRCHAAAFQRDMPRMDFELRFRPRDATGSDQEDKAKQRSAYEGQISLKLVNRLPFELTECWLIIGTTQIDSQNANNRRGGYSYNQQLPIKRSRSLASFSGDLVDVYHTRRLNDILIGSTTEMDFPSEFQPTQQHQELSRRWPSGSQIPPTISQLGSASAWIIGRMSRSPIMEIDQSNSDFVLQDEIHLFVQEILPEDLPTDFQFVNSNQHTVTNSQR